MDPAAAPVRLLAEPESVLGSLLAPVTVAGLELSNSFVMAPMTRARSPHGVPPPSVADYYRRRAGGGVGLIITEGVLVDHVTAGHEDSVPRMADGAAAIGWRHVVDEVHRAGGRIAAQLWHLGSLREPTDGVLPWSPSGVRETGRRVGVAMSRRDIHAIVDAFAVAARTAHRAGFDAIELHGAHGYLIDEFLWDATNRRDDDYGGTRRNRARFAADLVRAARDATGPGFPIIFRFSQHKERDYSARLATSPTQLEELLEPLVAAGASVLHASTRRWWEPAFPGSARNLAGWAKHLTGLPTITVGSVGLPPDALTGDGSRQESLTALAARHARGEFDLVALGRVLIADPSWVTLVASGRAREIVPYRKEQESVFP